MLLTTGRNSVFGKRYIDAIAIIATILVIVAVGGLLQYWIEKPILTNAEIVIGMKHCKKEYGMRAIVTEQRTVECRPPLTLAEVE